MSSRSDCRPKRRWLQFTLRQFFVLTLGIAIGFLPLKVWELFRPSTPAIQVQVRVMEIPSELMKTLSGSPIQSAKGIVVRHKLDESFLAQVDSYCRTDQAKVLMEGTMITLSSREAWMNSGGEFPVLDSQVDGRFRVRYKKFGDSVIVLPTLLRNGRIELQLRQRTSEIDNGLAVEMHGQSLPFIREKWAIASTVEVDRGEYFAISELAEHGGEREDGKKLLVVASVDVTSTQ